MFIPTIAIQPSHIPWTPLHAWPGAGHWGENDTEGQTLLNLCWVLAHGVVLWATDEPIPFPVDIH